MEYHICTLLILLSAHVNADTVYKTVSPTGEVIYSDTQSGSAQPMELNPNLVIEPLDSARLKPVNTTQSKKTKIDFQLTILSPEPEQTIRNNMGRVIIRADLTPVARGSFKLHLNQQEIVQKKPLFQLDNLERGEYIFYIEYIGNSGKILASSDKQAFYLHKASALIKAN
jgi:hypothetical protein